MDNLTIPPGYRGRKADLFRRFASGDVVPAPSRYRDIVVDDAPDLHWRTFYRYIREFCSDGHAVRRDARVGGYVMVRCPDVGDDPDDFVEVRLTALQAQMLLEVIDEYGGGVLSARSPLGAARAEIEAAVYGNDRLGF